MTKQKIITPENDFAALDEWMESNDIKKLMLVCGSSIRKQAVNGYLSKLGTGSDVNIVRFSDFSPNPSYDSIIKGVKVFRENGCDAIMAVGGGSAMDVAKCIKLYSNMDGDGEDGEFLRNTVTANEIPFMVMPTTAGTGSEATRFAVIYFKGNKQSVAHESCIPETVLMDPDALRSLPDYHRKASMLDALCHAVESCWSVNSTDESRRYADEAIRLIMEHKDAYLLNLDEGNRGMLLAANIAGKAINITQTTAGHAMCYKITGLLGCAHGHAAALCVKELFKWMVSGIDEGSLECIDPRGMGHVKAALITIGQAMGCEDISSAAGCFERLFDSLGLEIPAASEEQYRFLKTSVNPDRLKNHPVRLDEDTIDMLYHRILK